DELCASLSANGVDISRVEQVNDVSSGIAVILVIDGDNRIVLDKGANAKVDNALVERALLDAKAGDILIVQLEIAVETVEYALCLAKQKGMTTILNPAPAAPLSEAAFTYSDYFVPNQTETQFYTGIFPTDRTNAKSCADCLRAKGANNIIITLGELGSISFFGNEQVLVPATKVPVLDTTAAGDTFIGVFAGGLSEGLNKEQAMRLASAASALTVTKRGAQAAIPTREEITAFLAGKSAK
ncbi:MAG: ribokinase, partial [Clostridia bacterium]|nr:ribokinase [Clostridia bacterium]